MTGFGFPPPAKASGDGWDEVDYPRPAPGGGFIFPPPRVTDTGEAEENLRRFGQQLSAWGDLSEWSATTVSNLGVVVEDYGNVLERKVEPWAVPTIAGLFQTINRRADPTIPLSAFMSPLVRGRSDAAGHNHQHDTTSAAWGMAEGWTGSNVTYVAFITPAINRAYEQIHFMVGAVEGTPANMDMAIFVTDSDRQLHRQLGNVRISDGMSLGRTLVTYRFDRWVATQGSYIGIAIRQDTAGVRRPLLGLHDTPRPLGDTVFPRKITATRLGTTTIPAVIDGTTELDFEADWFIPYIELSEAIGSNLRTFGDLWPDIGEAIRPWLSMTSRGINSSGGYSAASGIGTRVSMYDTPLATDYIAVRSSVYRTFNNTRRATLIFRATNDLRSGLGLAVTHNTNYQIISWSNVAPSESWHTRTVVHTIARVPQEGDVLEIDYLAGLVTVRINGTQYVTDLPVGGPVGPVGRFLGIQHERTGDPIWPAFPSAWFGPWTARDVPAGSGGDDGDGEGEGEGDGD